MAKNSKHLLALLVILVVTPPSNSANKINNEEEVIARQWQQWILADKAARAELGKLGVQFNDCVLDLSWTIPHGAIDFSRSAMKPADFHWLEQIVNPTRLNLSKTAIEGRCLRFLRNWGHRVQWLILEDTKIGDNGLELLSACNMLSYLDLSGTNVTGKGLKCLASPLLVLKLSRTKIDDSDLESLRGLSSIQSLELASTKVTDQGIRSLRSLKDLTALNLADTRISGTGFISLLELSFLDTLQLSGTDTSDAETGLLAKLTRLRELAIRNTKITDKGLMDIAKLHDLRNLDLGGNAITDQGLESIKQMKNLKVLNVQKTLVTLAGVKAIQKSMPDLQVIWTSP
jgi:hypothetical protein